MKTKWGVKHHKIQVGDLIEYEYQQIQGDNHLGYVTKVDHDKKEITAFWSNDLRESPIYYTHDHEPIVGHWKVINFEEKKQMDELKVYTGKETIEALLEGKTLKYTEKEYDYLYRMTNGVLECSWQSKPFKKSNVHFNFISNAEFTEVVTPRVGDWVRVSILDGQYTYVAQATSIVDDRVYGKWSNPNEDTYYRTTEVDWEILTPEQVSEYKREQDFVKVGRKPNEYKNGDIVMINSIGKVGIVVSRNNESEIMIHEFNTVQGHKAKPHQLRPIAFDENQIKQD